jgi:hypothetical protein
MKTATVWADPDGLSRAALVQLVADIQDALADETNDQDRIAVIEFLMQSANLGPRVSGLPGIPSHATLLTNSV